MDYCGKSFYKLLILEWSFKEIQQTCNEYEHYQLHLWMQKANNKTCMNMEQARMDPKPSNLRL